MKEEKLGILYFFVLVGVLVSIWFVLMVSAINIQYETAKDYVKPVQSNTQQ